jgi:hypothetical protein
MPSSPPSTPNMPTDSNTQPSPSALPPPADSSAPATPPAQGGAQ